MSDVHKAAEALDEASVVLDAALMKITYTSSPEHKAIDQARSKVVLRGFALRAALAAETKPVDGMVSDEEWIALGRLLADPPNPPQWLLDAVRPAAAEKPTPEPLCGVCKLPKPPTYAAVWCLCPEPPTTPTPEGDDDGR